VKYHFHFPLFVMRLRDFRAPGGMGMCAAGALGNHVAIEEQGIL